MSDVVKLVLLGLFCVTLVVGLVALFVCAAVSSAKDKRALEQWAMQNGWGLVRNTSLPFADALPHKRRGEADYLLHSRIEGWPVAVAKWTWESGTSGSDDHEVHSATVTAVKLSESFPELSITPRRRRGLIPSLTKWASDALGTTETVQLGHAPFDAAYEIEVDEDALDTAHRLIGPRTAAEMLAQGQVIWGVVGNDLFRWTDGWARDPNRLQPEIDGLLRVAKALGT